MSDFTYSPTDRVFQAARTAADQLGCGPDEAFQRIIIRARATGVDPEYVALDIIDRIIRFDE